MWFQVLLFILWTPSPKQPRRKREACTGYSCFLSYFFKRRTGQRRSDIDPGQTPPPAEGKARPPGPLRGMGWGPPRARGELPTLGASPCSDRGSPSPERCVPPSPQSLSSLWQKLSAIIRGFPELWQEAPYHHRASPASPSFCSHPPSRRPALTPRRQTFSSLRAMVGRAAPSASAWDAAQHDHRRPRGGRPPPAPVTRTPRSSSGCADAPPSWAAAGVPARTPRSFLSPSGAEGPLDPRQRLLLHPVAFRGWPGGRKHPRLLPVPSRSSSSPMSIPRWPVSGAGGRAAQLGLPPSLRNQPPGISLLFFVCRDPFVFCGFAGWLRWLWVTVFYFSAPCSGPRPHPGVLLSPSFPLHIFTLVRARGGFWGGFGRRRSQGAGTIPAGSSGRWAWCKQQLQQRPSLGKAYGGTSPVPVVGGN